MMEEISAIIPQHQPLRVLWCLFVWLHPMNYHFVPQPLVTPLYSKQSSSNQFNHSSDSLIKSFLLLKLSFLCSTCFSSFFIFIAHFSWTSVNPRISFILYMTLVRHSRIPSFKLAPPSVLCVLRAQTYVLNTQTTLFINFNVSTFSKI